VQWSEHTIDQIYKIIGERIRARRVEADMTQTELGQRVQLTRSSIANIEAGRQRAMLHTIMQIANELDIEPHALFPKPDFVGSESRLLGELAGQPPSTLEFVQSVVRRASAR
jgi:transcriptional regulator with XRE-family HTH domain